MRRIIHHDGETNARNGKKCLPQKFPNQTTATTKKPVSAAIKLTAQHDKALFDIQTSLTCKQKSIAKGFGKHTSPANNRT